ncbi:MAG: HEAT repeat domain-containing protein [Candidatus Tectomicrobia bacterium]|uniref:HEAT repeat domain-containing protein n=1 Tax=Tectimicrobiota bacterium TaxID=2528274 RepID=A0A932CQ13_UNCTE|nr:HEAT repeat domain-containing protein [Candidatus Tectomicrobia bacterium]
MREKWLISIVILGIMLILFGIGNWGSFWKQTTGTDSGKILPPGQSYTSERNPNHKVWPIAYQEGSSREQRRSHGVPGGTSQASPPARPYEPRLASATAARTPHPASPERLASLLKASKWGEALALYGQVYPSPGRQGVKELRLICQGLLKDALKGKDLFDRIQAAGALVEGGDRSSFGFLEEIRSAEDPLIRASVYQEMVEILGDKGDPMVLFSLQKGLSDKDDMVRIQLMEALKRRKAKEASVLPLLEKALKDGNFAVRSAAAEALGDLAHPSAQALLEKAVRDEHRYVRLSAMSSLARRGIKTHLQELSQATKDQDPGVKERAAGLIGRSRSHSFSPLLKGMLKEEKRDDLLRITLAGSLAELGDQGGIPLLEKSLHHPKSHLRLSTVKALGRSHQKSSLPLLRQALKDEDPSIRTFAVIYLGEMEDREALQLLTQQLKDKDPWVRMSSAQVLGEIGNAALIGPLHELLQKEEDPGVKVFTLRALSRILRKG